MRSRCRSVARWADRRGWLRLDRKSTRLNSSHPSISYAVFCLKKKKRGELHRSAEEARPGAVRAELAAAEATGGVGPSIGAAGQDLAARAGLRRQCAGRTDGVLLPSVTPRHCPVRGPSTAVVPGVSRPPFHPPGASCRESRKSVARCTPRVAASRPPLLTFFFFLNNPAPPEISPLPLPDPLPI